MKRMIVAALLPVALMAGCSTSSEPKELGKRVVQLEVTGTPNDNVSVAYPGDGGGIAQNTNAYLPWRKNYDKTGPVSSISFTTTDLSLLSDTSLVCRIFVDGVEKLKVESSGGGTTVTCAGDF